MSAQAPDAPPGVPRGGSERILLVEDEPAVRRTATRALRFLGYTVVDLPAAEPAMALSDLELAEVDLLVTDVRLPGLDGTRLAQELSSRSPRLLTILMSGHVETAAQREVVASGQFKFLPKPFTVDDLAEIVRGVLDAAVVEPAS
jgi:two-component system cell cycle sensor histidine kinase/response regulator CckA